MEVWLVLWGFVGKGGMADFAVFHGQPDRV